MERKNKAERKVEHYAISLPSAEWLIAFQNGYATAAEDVLVSSDWKQIVEQVNTQIEYAKGRLVNAGNDGDTAGEEAWRGYLNALRWVKEAVLCDEVPTNRLLWDIVRRHGPFVHRKHFSDFQMEALGEKAAKRYIADSSFRLKADLLNSLGLSISRRTWRDDANRAWVMEAALEAKDKPPEDEGEEA